MHAFLSGDAARWLRLRECNNARMSSRQQALLLLALAFASLMILPFSFPEGRVPPAGQNPIPWLLMILTIVVGFPFFVMSTIAPTLQKWFEGIGHESSSDPYFLYAASNVGSLLGLLSYPLLIEPRFRLAEQSRLWEYGYVLLALLMAVCALRYGAHRSGEFQMIRLLPKGNVPPASARVPRALALDGSRVRPIKPNARRDDRAYDRNSADSVAVGPTSSCLSPDFHSRVRKEASYFLFRDSSKHADSNSGGDDSLAAESQLATLPGDRHQSNDPVRGGCGLPRRIGQDGPPTEHLTGFYLWIALGVSWADCSMP